MLSKTSARLYAESAPASSPTSSSQPCSAQSGTSNGPMVKTSNWPDCVVTSWVMVCLISFSGSTVRLTTMFG